MGKIRKAADGKSIYLDPRSYDSAAWNNKRKPVRVFVLVGTEVLTTDVAVGRSDPDANAQVQTILEANKCLHVQVLAFQRYSETTNTLFSPVYGLKDIPAGSDEQKLIDVMAYAQARDTRSCRNSDDPDKPRTPAANASKSNDETQKSGKTLPGPPQPAPQICVRTIVWAKAQKVTC